jgi:hypothetical protein
MPRSTLTSFRAFGALVLLMSEARHAEKMRGLDPLPSDIKA